VNYIQQAPELLAIAQKPVFILLHSATPFDSNGLYVSSWSFFFFTWILGKKITQHYFLCHFAPVYPGILKTNENIPKVMNYIGAWFCLRASTCHLPWLAYCINEAHWADCPHVQWSLHWEVTNSGCHHHQPWKFWCSFYIVVYSNFYIVINIVRQMGSHFVNIITLYFALFWKFCIGGLMMVFADQNMLSCLSKNKYSCVWQICDILLWSSCHKMTVF